MGLHEWFWGDIAGFDILLGLVVAYLGIREYRRGTVRENAVLKIGTPNVWWAADRFGRQSLKVRFQVDNKGGQMGTLDPLKLRFLVKWDPRDFEDALQGIQQVHRVLGKDDYVDSDGVLKIPPAEFRAFEADCVFRSPPVNGCEAKLVIAPITGTGDQRMVKVPPVPGYS